MTIQLLILNLLFFTNAASAYPEFIGYKYSSCITCHYNGQGNGPLNDYGRALWSAEIAGRVSNASAEQLGESSGFLGKKELPWWIRPGIKARGLYYKMNPPGGRERTILMQAEANVAVFFDQDQKYAFIGSYGYAPTMPGTLTNQGKKPNDWISREHYFRVAAIENLWLYLGMMDKVYGIRIANHTAFSRSKVGVAMNDQSHGVIAHYIQPKWEATINGFVGNLYQEAELRQKGVSTLLEYELKEAWRIGVTGLASQSDVVKNIRYGALTKYGFGDGAAILFEAGHIQNIPKIGETRKGYYVYSEAIKKIVRGYHVFVTGQAYKERMIQGKADTIVGGFGILMFPMARVELRFDVENGRSYSNLSDLQSQYWNLMAQLHLSL